MEKYNSEFFFNNLIFTLIILAASFLQISLNFLSIFVISQPYILAIILFLTLRRVDYEVSSILIILNGLLYDLITGGLIGIHSLLFLFLKLLEDVVISFFSSISSKLGLI